MSCNIGNIKSEMLCCCGFSKKDCFYKHSGICPSFKDNIAVKKHIKHIDTKILSET